MEAQKTKIRDFYAWKAQAMIKLLAIKAAHKDNPKIVQDVDTLITKLQYLKVKELSSFIAAVHHASVDTDEFLIILPTEEEIEAWFEKENE
jgi:pantothenate kinase-related protein Tda10